MDVNFLYHRSRMDNLYEFYYTPPQAVGLLLAVAIAILISTVLYRAILVTDDEAPITFAVPVPEQCKPEWKGRILDEPSVKVMTDAWDTNMITCADAVADTGLKCHTMLLPSQWTTPGTVQSHNTGWCRQSGCQSERSAGIMGEDNIQATAAGSEDDVEVRLGVSCLSSSGIRLIKKHHIGSYLTIKRPSQA